MIDTVDGMATLPSRLLGRPAGDPFHRHAALMRHVRERCGIVPDYEFILERTYRPLIKPGDTVIDVGAHTGRHTAVFRDLVGGSGTVLAFEPLPDIAQVLRSRGLDDRVQVFECALSDFSGRTSFIHARGSPEESGLRPRTYTNPAAADPATIDVEVRRLDEFLPSIDKLCFVKLDIEGAELSCLRGAQKVIGRFRPTISVEYGATAYGAYGETERSLFDFAELIDYRIGDLFGATCPDLATWLRVCNTSFWDYLLVPSERHTARVAGGRHVSRRRA